MKSAFIKVQNTFQYLTYEVVNDYDTPYWGAVGPTTKKTKKKNGRVIAEPTLQAHETRLTNRTFVLQRSQRTEEENEMTRHSVSKIYIVHILGEINLVKYFITFKPLAAKYKLAQKSR